MSTWVTALLATASLYVIFVVSLVALGRREHARALAGFVPDCLILFKRLLTDPRVSRPRRALVAATAFYLASPIDLVPDFIPVAGQLDDAVLVALTLRVVLRGGGPAAVEENWPGPPASLRLVLRMSGGVSRSTGPAASSAD